jgi:hypothetical protein
MEQERATRLTPAMLRTLERLADATDGPCEIKSTGLADALMQRGFIVRHNPTQHTTWGKQYWITPRGRTALLIGARGYGHAE